MDHEFDHEGFRKRRDALAQTAYRAFTGWLKRKEPDAKKADVLAESARGLIAFFVDYVYDSSDIYGRSFGDANEEAVEFFLLWPGLNELFDTLQGYLRWPAVLSLFYQYLAEIGCLEDVEAPMSGLSAVQGKFRTYIHAQFGAEEEKQVH